MALDPDQSRLHHGVSRELGIEIIEGRWAVEEARTLEDLQDRFGVSRTVAREVSRRLEAMGMVRARRRRGLMAQPIAQWNVLDITLIDWRLHSSDRLAQLASLTQLRLAVEPLAAEGIARHASIHERARLLPIAAEMRRTGEAGDLREFLGHDIQFHRHILTNSGNELFAALSPLVATVLSGRTELDLMPPHPEPAALAAHEAVAEAVFRGDGPGARVAMQLILDEVRSALGDG